MEFLSRLYGQVSRIFGRLTASQRVTFLLLVAMIAGSLVLLVALSGGGDWVPLTSEALSAEETAKAAADLDQAGLAHRESGGQVLVRPADRYRALAAIFDGKGAPSNSRAFFGFNELVSQSGGLGSLRTADQVTLQKQIALQTELARTLCEFRGVKAARVFLSEPSRRTLGPPGAKDQSASVSLWLTPGEELNAARVSSVANLVAGAVLGLSPSRVTVIDQERGLSRQPPTEDAAVGATLLEQKRDAERYLSERLREQLRYVPGLIAQASVELRPQQEHRTIDTVRPDESVIPRRTTERRETSSVGGATAGLSAGSGATAGTGGSMSLTPAAAPTSEVVETTDETLGEEYSKDHSVLSIPAGTIERITATITIPDVYYREMASRKLPAPAGGQAPEPTEAQIAAEIERDRPNVQKIALGVLGPKAKAEDVTVDVRYVPTEPAAVAAAAVTSGGGLGAMLERYGTAGVLVGLSLGFLAVLSRWVKAQPNAAARRRGAEEGTVAAADTDAAVLLPANAELSADARRLGEMRKRIQDLVKQDPANAANLVSRWLNQG